MAYRIFLSHCGEDAEVARAIKTAVVNAFDGYVDVYMATDELAGGQRWKQALLEELERSNALMSVMTKDSYERPWLMLEWSAFWLRDKTYYVLVADGLPEDKLFRPMLERQVTRLSDEAQVRRLFAFLNAESSHGAVPFHYVPPLIESVRAAIQEKERAQYESSYAVYRESDRPLPVSDREKEPIAEFFMDTGERDHFARVCAALRDDEVKTRLAHKLVKQRNMDLIPVIAEMIDDTGRLQEIIRQMIDAQMTDEMAFRRLVDTLAGKNQAEYRKVLLHLTNRGEEETALFHRLVANLTNMAEARKVGEHLIQNRRGFRRSLPELIHLIGRSNRAELRKLVIELMFNNLQRDPVFEDAMRTLASGSQREMEKTMTALLEHDEEAFARFMDLGLVTDESVLARLRELRS
jgi:hypothetical protein